MIADQYIAIQMTTLMTMPRIFTIASTLQSMPLWWWRLYRRGAKDNGGRRGGIRTRDPLHPMQVRYQAALHADKLRIIACAVPAHYMEDLLDEGGAESFPASDPPAVGLGASPRRHIAGIRTGGSEDRESGSSR
jgi:hypothetical protein